MAAVQLQLDEDGTVQKANVILGEQHSGISWWGVDKVTLDTNRSYNPAGQYVTPSGENRYYENQTDNYWQNHYQLLYTREINKNFNKVFLCIPKLQIL